MTNESEQIRILSQKIIRSLESSETDGLKKYKSILLENEEKSTTFDEYLDQLQRKLKKCTCQSSWNTDVLIIRCHDCQADTSSCICVDCFLKGNHKGHKVMITHGSSGCCDCGDPFGWSKSGFCCDHSGPEQNPEQTQLDQSTRIKLISISNSALYYSRQFANTNVNYFNNIIKFLLRLVSLGDATRRCVSISMCEYFDPIDLYTNSKNFDTYQYELLHKLISSISSDDVFRTHFTITVYNNFPKIIQMVQNISSHYTNPKKQPLLSMISLVEVTFFGTISTVIDKLVSESKIDFSKILNESLHFILFYDDDKLNCSFARSTWRFPIFQRLLRLLKSSMKIFGGKNSKVIEIIEKLTESMSKKEFSLPFVRVFGSKADDFDAIQGTIFDIRFDIRDILSKVIKYNIFTTKPLFELKKFFDSPIYKSIDKLVNDYQIYFHSVLSKNVNICQSIDLHLYSFFCLNLKEEKKLIDYISEVTDDVELFIKRWAVLPLRWMAASILSDFNFFVRNTDDTIIAFKSFKYHKNIKYSFTPIFVLIQSLLKSTKDVDKFLLMIISTFDLSVINDYGNCNFDTNEKQLILFCIFHFISCLIFDTLCSSRNFYMMHRLTIVSELMFGNMNIEEINDTWFNVIFYDDKLLDDLKSITSKITTKNGTMFHLTDDSEWHPLIPHLNLPKIIQLTQKFITKNPDSLINFPTIPEGNEYLLFSPTLWALEYCILDNHSCKDYRIIHQLIFNILIVTANNSDSFYKGKENQNLKDDDSILHVDDFENLIEKLKNLTFNQFMRKKIDFNMNNEDDGKSMIDLISCLGNIGITVLKRMNISDIDTNSSEENLLLKQEMKKKNKERANKFKSEMMNNFIQKQKNFQSTVLNNQNFDEKVSKIECGICHVENESDCFVYPAVIFKSSLSTYIKWRFHNAKLIKSNDTEINSIDFTNIPETFESYNSVHICLHPIHSHCIKSQNYSCPADRCSRNSSLPIVDGIFDFNSISNKSLHNEVLKFISNTYNDDINCAVFSLASEIEVLEMRHRSNPNCLDNKTVAATLRNIYLCIWQVLHSNTQKALENEEFKRRRKEITKKVEDKTWNEYKNRVLKLDFSGINDDLSIESKVDKICQILEFEAENQTSENKTFHLSPLMKYILYSMDLDNKNSSQFLNMKKFITGKLLPSKIQQINNSKINSIDDEDSIFNDFDVINELSSDYQKLQFLRCAAIFDHFARNKKISQTNNKIDEFIDWDEILSSSFLQKYYEINDSNDDDNEDDDDELMLPVFSLFNVPNNFLDFLRPPFSLPVNLNQSENKTAICLLTGQAVSLSSLNDKFVQIEDFVDQKFCGSFSIFLALNGSRSSDVFISTNNPYHEVSLKSFYINKFDEVDLGLNKRFLLFLNESKRDEIVDNFLSGSWTDSFHS